MSLNLILENTFCKIVPKFTKFLSLFSHPIAESKAYVDTYGKPWCRAAVYLVGMWGGMLLHYYKDKQLKLKIVRQTSFLLFKRIKRAFIFC